MMMIQEVPAIKQEPNQNNHLQGALSNGIQDMVMYDKEKKVTKYKCEICDKHFAKKPTLKLHMR